MHCAKRGRILYCFLQNYTTNSKPKIVPDESVLSDIDKNVYNPKNHPGIFKPRTVTIPEMFIKAVANVLEDYPAKSLIEDGQKLITHLKGKRPPVEKLERKKIEQDVYNKVLSRHNIPKLETEENRLKFQQLIDNKVSIILKKDVYNWKPVNYDTYNALVYLMSRSAAEYAVLAKIFLEISERDPQFKPRSLFDFGSGVGTATWAANLYWKKNIFEYFNVDSSSEMNDLAQILLQSGKGTNKMELRGVFYRQFLPSANTTYDLVISAYTFLELPSRHSRLETILNLWNKTQKYLVVVEQGTNAGFQIINEIRDFILYTKDKSDGYIFSPCPHDEVCPRFMLNDGTPCNFEVHYFTLPIGAVSRRRQEKYSYIVFKKGKRESSNPQWPRIVRETLVRPRHTICRMCTKDAKLEEVIFTASKHGKEMYRCARASKWGDLVPVALETALEEDTSEDKTNLKTEQE